MISTLDAANDPLFRDRLVFVAAGQGDPKVVESLREMYPTWSVVSCDSYLSGIAEVARRPARAVLAWIAGGDAKLEDAVGGLREAAGPDSKLILCCSTDREPLAHRTVSAGADDYVLVPLDQSELDAVLGHPRRTSIERVAANSAAGVGLEEISGWADMLSKSAGRPKELIESLARLLRRALPTRGAGVIVEGATAFAGEIGTQPVLTAPIHDGDRLLGQLTLGAPLDAPYAPADIDKLTRYADLAGRALKAASDLHRWRTLAMTDECTGLPNRRYLLEKLDEILTHAKEERFTVTVLLFDVDNFKSYNDRYGHDAGDEILRVTGELFRRHCREQDIVTRFGGDEYVVVFWDPEGPRVPGSQHPEEALAVLDRFKKDLQSHRFPCLGAAGTGQLTISGGLATYPWDGTTRDTLLNRADEALLAAKRAGKNRIFLIGEGNAS